MVLGLCRKSPYSEIPFGITSKSTRLEGLRRYATPGKKNFEHNKTTSEMINEL